MFPLVLHFLQQDCVDCNVNSMWMCPSVCLQWKTWSCLSLQMWRYCWCNSDMSPGSCKNTPAVLLCDSLHLWSSSQHCEWCYCQPSNQSFSWTSPLSEVSVPGFILGREEVKICIKDSYVSHDSTRRWLSIFCLLTVFLIFLTSFMLELLCWSSQSMYTLYNSQLQTAPPNFTGNSVTLKCQSPIFILKKC